MKCVPTVEILSQLIISKPCLSFPEVRFNLDFSHYCCG